MSIILDGYLSSVDSVLLLVVRLPVSIYLMGIGYWEPRSPTEIYVDLHYLLGGYFYIYVPPVCCTAPSGAIRVLA
jgi:hypothetical protein